MHQYRVFFTGGSGNTQIDGTEEVIKKAQGQSRLQSFALPGNPVES